MDELRFDGRTAIVTGAGRGFGRCHAMLLAARGANVVVADYGVAIDGSAPSDAPADEVVAEIRAAGGNAVACFADVSDEAGAASIVDAAVDTFGGLDIVVNNAGIVDARWFGDLDGDAFRRLADVHYLGTVYVCLAAWPHLKAAEHGRIVNTTSEGMLGNIPKNTPYAGGKGAVFGFTKSLALDGVQHGILANAFSPRGSTRLSAPSLLSTVFDKPEEAFYREGDRLAAEKTSPAVAFLAHESCQITGEVLVAGLGQVMRMAVVTSAGLTSDDLTPEVVAAGIDQIMDLTDATVVNAGRSIN